MTTPYKPHKRTESAASSLVEVLSRTALNFVTTKPTRLGRITEAAARQLTQFSKLFPSTCTALLARCCDSTS